MQAKPPARPVNTLTFRVSCWAFAVMAFVQLLTVGVAMALRLDREPTGPVVVREVIRYVPQPDGAESMDPEETTEASPALPVTPFVEADIPAQPAAFPRVPLPPPPPLTTPPVADPLLDRLLSEAREARVAEDMRKALTKLNEAEALDPEEPNLLYEFGMVYETMGINDRAAEYYQRVFEMGTTRAGTLYEAAARKIGEGFAQPEDQRGRLSLGRVRVFHDKRVEEGDRVILTIPIHALAGEDLDTDEIQVQVNFFDQDEKREILPAGPDASTKIEWLSEPVDWEGPGEELLRVTYTIPPADHQQAHLFGTRSYYGQVVELSYQGTLIDSQAWPRHLARKMNAPESQPLFLPENLLPEDYNPGNPLLPLPVR